jgi:hypothetical protein
MVGEESPWTGSVVEVKHVDGDRQWRCGMLRDSAWSVGEVEDPVS